MNNVTEMHSRDDEIRCPICDDWDLDTGGECSHCGYDRNKTLNKHERAQAWLKVRNKPKSTIIEFLRNHE